MYTKFQRKFYSSETFSKDEKYIPVTHFYSTLSVKERNVGGKRKRKQKLYTFIVEEASQTFCSHTTYPVRSTTLLYATGVYAPFS